MKIVCNCGTEIELIEKKTLKLIQIMEFIALKVTQILDFGKNMMLSVLFCEKCGKAVWLFV